MQHPVQRIDWDGSGLSQPVRREWDPPMSAAGASSALHAFVQALSDRDGEGALALLHLTSDAVLAKSYSERLVAAVSSARPMRWIAEFGAVRADAIDATLRGYPAVEAPGPPLACAFGTVTEVGGAWLIAFDMLDPFSNCREDQTAAREPDDSSARWGINPTYGVFLVSEWDGHVAAHPGPVARDQSSRGVKLLFYRGEGPPVLEIETAAWPIPVGSPMSLANVHQKPTDRVTLERPSVMEARLDRLFEQLEAARTDRVLIDIDGTPHEFAMACADDCAVLHGEVDDRHVSIISRQRIGPDLKLHRISDLRDVIAADDARHRDLDAQANRRPRRYAPDGGGYHRWDDIDWPLYRDFRQFSWIVEAMAYLLPDEIAGITSSRVLVSRNGRDGYSAAITAALGRNPLLDSVRFDDPWKTSDESARVALQLVFEELNPMDRWAWIDIEIENERLVIDFDLVDHVEQLAASPIDP